MTSNNSWLALPQHKVMLWRSPSLSSLQGIDHRSLRIKGQPLALVRWDADTYAKLQMAGCNPPPLARGYEYTGLRKPWDHQRATVEFLVQNGRSFCLNGLRTGKTASALWAADCLIKLGLVRRVLVLCTKSTVESVWAREMFQVTPHLQYAILEGTKDSRIVKARDLTKTVLITNHEAMLYLKPEHLPDVDLIIVDEATKFKNWRAQRTQRLSAVAKARIWMLTGTPSPQAPTDAYGMIRLQRSGRYETFTQFQSRTMVKVSQFRWVPREGAAEIVAAEMRPAIRFKREDCIDIPDVEVVDQDCPLSDKQRRIVKEFLTKAWADLEGKVITAANAAGALSKALQVMCGGVYAGVGNERSAHSVEADPFYEAIENIIEETDGPVILLAPYKVTVAVLAERLEADGKLVGCVTGDTSGSERAKIFAAFQNGELDALIAIPQTIAHGLELTRSNTIVWLSPPMSFETYEQANARIQGSSQKRKCMIVRLVQNRLSRELFKRLDTRASLQEAILTLMEADR